MRPHAEVHLYIVKGINQWRKQQRASLKQHWAGRTFSASIPWRTAEFLQMLSRDCSSNVQLRELRCPACRRTTNYLLGRSRPKSDTSVSASRLGIGMSPGLPVDRRRDRRGEQVRGHHPGEMAEPALPVAHRRGAHL